MGPPERRRRLVERVMASRVMRRMRTASRRSEFGRRTASVSNPEAYPPGDDLNLRILRPLLDYVADAYGTEALEELAEAAQLTTSELAGTKGWISWHQFEQLLEGARELMEDEEEFRLACGYRMKESYGPIAFLVRATSIRRVWELMVRTMHLVSHISRVEIVDSGRRHIHVRYSTSRPESRLMCLSRQGQYEAIPTQWGLPEAEIEERSCVAAGDAACEYLVRWYVRPRWFPALGGSVLGAALAWAMAALGLTTVPQVALLALVGALAGHVMELRWTNRANLEFGEETNRGLRQVAREYEDAAQEALALHKRQRDWSRVLEEQVTERTNSFQGLLERLQELGQRRDSTLRSFSHDLRNPLTVLKGTGSELRQYVNPRNTEATEVIDDLEDSVAELERMVGELMRFATESGRTDLVKLSAGRLDVGPQIDRLRRRLRALVLGRDIRVSVFATREAPESIETDVLVFDRVIDNLLANAAKYTKSGSIVVELTGMPGMLTVKVSDTGPGISGEHIERVFRANQSVERPQVGSGYGLGLSIVVQLLDQIGGRLEVMSKPNVGTTFWAHFPVQLPPEGPRISVETPESLDQIIGRVVTIRRVVNG